MPQTALSTGAHASVSSALELELRPQRRLRLQPLHPGPFRRHGLTQRLVGGRKREVVRLHIFSSAGLPAIARMRTVQEGFSCRGGPRSDLTSNGFEQIKR